MMLIRWMVAVCMWAMPFFAAILCCSGKVSVREGYLEVPGGKVWYRIAGEGEPGIPLLILHGGPGAPHHYLDNAICLADKRPAIWYDQLGCGLSPAR